ncbi:MAG: radical SAM protein [Muribaculaceae bacterium]|nr:radical SAM protein [Muribaculaceae bacterium]
MRKINEIFLSLQGEGCHTGLPSIFIRFSGCNLSCHFCDTVHMPGKFLSDSEIIDEVKKYKAAQIVLTGGEPSLFIDEDFIALLKSETGLPIAIETNGTHHLPSNIDWITVSPKLGMSKSGDDSLNTNFIADELKIVDLGQNLEPYFSLECVGQKTKMLLQPCYVSDSIQNEKNLRNTIKRVVSDPRWRLSLQTHRLLNIP